MTCSKSPYLSADGDAPLPGSLCDSQQYANANVDARKWCKTTMNGRHKAQIFASLTQGSFGFEVSGNAVEIPHHHAI